MGSVTKTKLLEFLKENPGITAHQIREYPEYYAALRREFGDRINQAKREAGVPEEFINPTHIYHSDEEFLEVIRNGFRTYREISEKLKVSRSVVSRHVRALEEEGRLRIIRLPTSGNDFSELFPNRAFLILDSNNQPALAELIKETLNLAQNALGRYKASEGMMRINTQLEEMGLPHLNELSIYLTEYERRREMIEIIAENPEINPWNLIPQRGSFRVVEIFNELEREGFITYGGPKDPRYQLTEKGESYLSELN